MLRPIEKTLLPLGLACGLLAAGALAPAARADGLDVNDLQVLNDRSVPEVCFSFNVPLPEEPEAHLEDYVRVSPEAEEAVTASDDRLCIAGLAFGTSYEVRLRGGLPAKDGATLPDDLSYDVYVPDRPSSIAFQGDRAYVLVKDLAKGLPLRSVNLPAAELKVIRVNDRNLVPQLAEGQLAGEGQLYPGDVERYAEEAGVTLWSGTLELPQGKANEALVSQLPVADFLKEPEPGLYLAVAREPDADPWSPWASQWFLVSDIGLTSFKGDNALWVFARSLADAGPMAELEVALLAKDNKVLGTGRTDAAGKLVFDAPLLRGPGGNAPRALLAYGAAGDFAYLDLAAPTLDLSDRPIGGRTPPAAVEAYLYTERGIYRPGEAVHLVGLARDRALAAATALPLTFKLWLPDGSEFRSQVAADAGGGSHAWDFELPGSARTGQWEATAHLGPKGPAIGRVSFEVEDFVPPQIEFALASAQKSVAAGKSIEAKLDADYLYGAPAANLAGEYTLITQPAADPYPAFPGYHFGLVQETVRPQRSEPATFATGEDGRVRLSAEVPPPPASNEPLSVSLRAAVFDIGGRAVYRRITLPLEDKPFYLGISPDFQGGSVGQGQPARFRVIALDRAGEEQPLDDLQYAVYREDYDYVWYREYGQWKARWVVRDQLVDQGSLFLTPGQPGEIDFTPDWGPYRVEVRAAAAGVASSYRFSGGWWSNPSADTPDDVEVSLDKESYRAGETAKVFVKPPFAARLLVTVADASLRRSMTAEIGKEGGVIEVPVADDWSAGAYVLVTAYPTAPASIEAMPSRAVGLAWMAMEQASHRLQVSLELPERIEPKRRLEVPVTVAGSAAGAPLHLTLAAVDDAVLQLTGYQAPDPLDWLMGKQAFALSLHDVYGYLIRPEGEVLARLRSGGDQEGRNLESLPKRSSKVVSLFSGIVATDAAGKATVALEVPDFNGRLRLMAVAWSPAKLGNAQDTLLVRAPLVAEVTLPRFLAPGDKAEALLSLRNLDGAAGDYRVALEGDAVVSVAGEALAAQGLAQGKEARGGVTLTGERVGVAGLSLTVSGPEGYRLERRFDLSVRPASPTVTERRVALLQPGRGATVSDATATGFLPETASVGLSLSAVPDFDLPALLGELDRYPYGCAEQITSRALPLLYVNRLSGTLGLADDAGAGLKVQQAIYRLMNQQRSGGAFGLWGPYDQPQVWLSAYVADFLTRARSAGFVVPEAGYEALLDTLEGATKRYLSDPEDFASYAYAQSVLARAGRGNLSELRYFYETRFDKLPTPFARAQFAAALAHLGDAVRADAAFSAAEGGSVLREVRYADYGSKLRDDAALVALMAESGVAPGGLLADTSQRLSRDFAERRYLSTQEMAWLVLAGQGLLDRAGPLAVAVDGTPVAEPGAAVYRRLSLRQGGPQSLTMENRGEGPIYQVVTVTGVPEEPLPPSDAGFTLRRRVFDLKGLPVDLQALRQGASYVVLLEGRARDGRDHRALLVDLLPAGWEIENAALGQGVPLESFPWLGELSVAEHREARDDRFAAGLELTEEEAGFRVAYIVRAVTPGSFALPGTYIEDMYRPDISARGRAGSIDVTAR